MTIQPLIAAWSPLPLAAKLAVGVALLVLVILVSGAVGGIVTRVKDARFDKERAEEAAGRAADIADRDAALRRAESAEAKVSVLEVQNEAQKQLLVGAGRTVVAKDKAVQEVVDEYNREIDAVGTPGQSPAERAADVRRRLRELGYLLE